MVTLKEVAAAAKVSTVTASSVLSGVNRVRVASKTAQRIHDIAKSMNYVPLAAARGLRTGKTRIIAFVASMHSYHRMDESWHESLRGVADLMWEREERLMLVMPKNRENSVETLRQMAFGRQVDGFIIQELGMDSERLDLLNKAERPFVVMGGQPIQGVNGVSFNFAGFAKTVADAICERYGAAVAIVPGGDRLSAFARFGGNLEEHFAKHGMKLRIWDKAFVPGPEWLTEAKREAGDKPLHITLLRGLLPETLHALNTAGLVPGKDANVFYMSSGKDLIMPPQGVKIQHIDNYTLGRRSTQLLLQLIDSKIPATESRSIVIPVVPEV